MCSEQSSAFLLKFFQIKSCFGGQNSLDFLICHRLWYFCPPLYCLLHTYTTVHSLSSRCVYFLSGTWASQWQFRVQTCLFSCCRWIVTMTLASWWGGGRVATKMASVRQSGAAAATSSAAGSHPTAALCATASAGSLHLSSARVTTAIES